MGSFSCGAQFLAVTCGTQLPVRDRAGALLWEHGVLATGPPGMRLLRLCGLCFYQMALVQTPRLSPSSWRGGGFPCAAEERTARIIFSNCRWQWAVGREVSVVGYGQKLQTMK